MHELAYSCLTSYSFCVCGQMTAIQNHFCSQNVSVNDVILFTNMLPRVRHTGTENLNIRNVVLVCKYGAIVTNLSKLPKL